MRLLGKPANFIIWEYMGPTDGRNRWSDGTNAVVITPSVDIWLNAAAPTAVRVFTNIVPLVRTGHGSYPVNMAEGEQPNPDSWVALGAAIVGGGVMPVNRVVPVQANGAPTWIRLVLTVPGDGYVKMVSKWQ